MQERLLAFFQFANSVTFKGHLKGFFEKIADFLSEKPHKMLGEWSRQFSQERQENCNFNFRPRTATFVYQ